MAFLYPGGACCRFRRGSGCPQLLDGWGPRHGARPDDVPDAGPLVGARGAHAHDTVEVRGSPVS